MRDKAIVDFHPVQEQVSVIYDIAPHYAAFVHVVLSLGFALQAGITALHPARENPLSSQHMEPE